MVLNALNIYFGQLSGVTEYLEMQVAINGMHSSHKL